MLPHYRDYSWNHTREEVRKHLVKHFLGTTGGTSSLDGTFIDTTGCARVGNQHAHLVATAQAMQAAAPDKIVGLHASDSVRDRFVGLGAAMDYTIARPGEGADAVAWMATNLANNVISLCHIGATLYDANYNYSLATFLAGANNMSYFAFSNTYKRVPSLFAQRWTDCSPNFTSPLIGSPPQRYPWPAYPTWCAGQGYSPDYFRPLGKPVTEPQPTGRGRGEVVRRFASGTNVTVALTGATCKIEWADGTTIVCAGGARAEKRTNKQTHKTIVKPQNTHTNNTHEARTKRGGWSPQPVPISTRWAASVHPGQVPAYPRPHFSRESNADSWLHLNGLWDLDYSTPKSLEDPPFGRSLPAQILVPYPLESSLGGIREQPAFGYMWYRRTLPALALGVNSSRVLLHFGAVDWECRVFVNGSLVGNHARTHARNHARTHTHATTHAQTHAHLRTQPRTHTHATTHAQTHAHANTHAHTHAYIGGQP